MRLSDLNNRDREVSHLKSQLRRAQNVSKAVWEYRDYIEEVKEYLALDELTGAQELFDEIPYKDQALLMTAPTKGGVFTTKERDVMKNLWIVSVEDIENH